MVISAEKSKIQFIREGMFCQTATMSASIGQATMKPQRRGQRQCRKRQEKTIQFEENRKRQLPFLLTIQHGINVKQSFCRPLESRSQPIWFPDLVLRLRLNCRGYIESHIYNKCVLSKPPTEPDCHILINSYCTSYEQSFCKIGDVEFVHQSLEEESSQLVAIASFKGKIYGVMSPGYKFVTIEFIGSTMEFRPILINGEQHWKAPVMKRNWVVRHYDELINSPFGDELLLVIKDFAHQNYFKIDGSEYRVFRVDINGMECIEVDDIGDHAILINYYGNGYCCSSNGTNTFFKPNSIYHTSENGAYVYVYDLDDKSSTSWLPPGVAEIKISDNYWLDLEELSC
ncbi:hypothetical protein CASFOL_019161 [Castilleja foliolosa]|uniref:KIB1-4 beta-propeller domain-containing protein n=1 Tax=Castilleja foliolosa TaxID=1961234 RepID=A0ABD3D576_9LAMI